jgi:hypothetical protein
MVFVYLVISGMISKSENEIMVELGAPLASEEGDQGWSSSMKLVHHCLQGTDDVFCLLFGLAGGDAFHAGLDSELSVVLSRLIRRAGSRVWVDGGAHVGGGGGETGCLRGHGKHGC